jgi:hypothetical protein
MTRFAKTTSNFQREESMKTRLYVAASAVLLCFSTLATANPVKVNIGYATAADYLPAFVSQENGCFAANGIAAQFTRIPVTTNIPAALIADTLQIGANTATLFLPAVENGLDLVAIAGGTHLLKGNETLSLVTGKQLTVKSGADVIGKRIGVPGINSVADVVFRKWLKNEGVDPSKVRIVETPFPQMKDLIKAGTIDGAIAVEPIRSSIVKDGVGHRAEIDTRLLDRLEKMGRQEPAGHRRVPEMPEGGHCLDRQQSGSGPRHREEISRLQHAGPARLGRRDQRLGFRPVRRPQSGIRRDEKAYGSQNVGLVPAIRDKLTGAAALFCAAPEYSVIPRSHRRPYGPRFSSRIGQKIRRRDIIPHGQGSASRGASLTFRLAHL